MSEALATRRVAFVFPGQGSQKVGMGRAWADVSEAARRTFEEADEALGESLSRLCWEGPEEELGLTVNTQPALLAASTAIHRALAGTPLADVVPVALAGHSLGEYSALVAAGALPFADALRLVRRRGELMQAAVPVGEGAMAAVLGLDAAAVAEVARQASADQEGELVAVANLNAPAQTVVAGHKAAVERAVALARERGARKATLLPVSAPFHSPLMRPARLGMSEPLREAPFAAPQVPVVANVDAAPVATAEAARDALARQIDGPVRWVESVQWMEREAGVDLFLELGPGNVLAGLIRRIAERATVASLGEPELVDKFLAAG